MHVHVDDHMGCNTDGPAPPATALRTASPVRQDRNARTATDIAEAADTEVAAAKAPRIAAAAVAAAAAARPSPGLPVPRFCSSAACGASAKVMIGHGTSVYRLRITGLGKLILTK